MKAKRRNNSPHLFRCIELTVSNPANEAAAAARGVTNEGRACDLELLEYQYQLTPDSDDNNGRKNKKKERSRLYNYYTIQSLHSADNDSQLQIIHNDRTSLVLEFASQKQRMEAYQALFRKIFGNQQEAVLLSPSQQQQQQEQQYRINERNDDQDESHHRQFSSTISSTATFPNCVHFSNSEACPCTVYIHISDDGGDRQQSQSGTGSMTVHHKDSGFSFRVSLEHIIQPPDRKSMGGWFSQKNTGMEITLMNRATTIVLDFKSHYQREKALMLLSQGRSQTDDGEDDDESIHPYEAATSAGTNQTVWTCRFALKSSSQTTIATPSSMMTKAQIVIDESHLAVATSLSLKRWNLSDLQTISKRQQENEAPMGQRSGLPLPGNCVLVFTSQSDHDAVVLQFDSKQMRDDFCRTLIDRMPPNISKYHEPRTAWTLEEIESYHFGSSSSSSRMARKETVAATRQQHHQQQRVQWTGSDSNARNSRQWQDLAAENDEVRALQREISTLMTKLDHMGAESSIDESINRDLEGPCFMGNRSSVSSPRTLEHATASSTYVSDRFSTDLSVQEINAIRQLLRNSRLDNRVLFDQRDFEEIEPLNDESESEESKDEGEAYLNKRELTHLPEDTFSFLIASPAISIPFATSVCVLGIKVIIYALIIANSINGSDDNPLGIPPGLTTPVIVAQYVALLITVVTQDDVVTSLKFLHEGYGKELQEAFPQATRNRWILTIFLSMTTGLLGLVVTFMLVIKSSDVVDLLLNFTAVEFVGVLDNAAFALSLQGFLGKSNRILAKYIERTEFHCPPNRMRATPLRQIFTLVITYSILVAGWAVIYIAQSNGRYTPSFLVVQFDDDLRFDMGPYSGAYQLAINRGASVYNRITYIHELHSNAMFGYCESLERWVFHTEGTDACENTLMRSSQIESFDIFDTSEISWFVTADVKKGRFYKMEDFSLELGCDYDEDCGGGGDAGSCIDSQCICEPGYYGFRCDFQEATTCTTLELEDGALEGTRTYATKYFALEQGGDLIFMYHRPVFLSEITSLQRPDIIFYSGYRWVLTRTSETFLKNASLAFTSENIADFLATTNLDLSRWLIESESEYLVSEPVRLNTPNDQATPLGLQWYVTQRSNSLPDEVSLQAPLDPTFFCGICNNSTNPCLNSNVCLSQGTCDCLHGAEGSLCQNIPVFNGLCNNEVYNTALYDFDGGDCCLRTCSGDGSNVCGVESIGSITAVYVGFPHCTDPGTFCDVKPCFVSKAETIPPTATRTEMFVTVSSNGRILVLREPSLDLVRVYDQTNSSWYQRGDTIEGIRNSNFGHTVALGTPTASLVARSTGSIPAVLAIASGSSGAVSLDIVQWSYNTELWSTVGFEIDACAEAQLDTCALQSLDVTFSNNIVRLVVVLDQNIVMVLQSPFEDEDEGWQTIKVLEGLDGVISGDGKYLAVVESTGAVVSILSFETNLETVVFSHDLGGFGTTIQGLRLSEDGSALSALVSSPDSQGAALVYQPVSSGSMTRSYVEDLDFSAETSAFEIADDGTAISLRVHESAGIEHIRTYRYSTVASRWQKIASEHSVDDLESQYAVSSLGKTLVVGGLETVSTFQADPACQDNEVTVRLSLSFADVVSAVTWSMQSVKFVGGIAVETNSLSKSCDGCYVDDPQFSRGLVSVESCLPEDECVFLDLAVEGGFDPGAGFALFYNGTLEAAMSEDSTVDLEIPSLNRANCWVEPLPTCNKGEDLLIVSLLFDANPGEVSWSLSFDQTKRAKSGFQSSYSIEQMCVPSDVCLTITFEDEGGDGFCCSSGLGSYTVYLNDELVISKDADFSFSERLYFGSCETRTARELTAALVLNLDYRANETYWQLKEVDGTVIAKKEPGDYAYLLDSINANSEDESSIPSTSPTPGEPSGDNCSSFDVSDYFNCTEFDCSTLSVGALQNATFVTEISQMVVNNSSFESDFEDWASRCLLSNTTAKLNLSMPNVTEEYAEDTLPQVLNVTERFLLFPGSTYILFVYFYQSNISTTRTSVETNIAEQASAYVVASGQNTSSNTSTFDGNTTSSLSDSWLSFELYLDLCGVGFDSCDVALVSSDGSQGFGQNQTFAVPFVCGGTAEAESDVATTWLCNETSLDNSSVLNGTNSTL